MANTNKTKAEILQELESIKGLLLEEDDIPILQDTEVVAEGNYGALPPQQRQPTPYSPHESVLPGQGSLFDEPSPKVTMPSEAQGISTLDGEFRKPTIPAAAAANRITPSYNARPTVKAAGENPFLPQHIRERLHGNNPPPLFEYEAARKIAQATKSSGQKPTRPRQHLVDEVIKCMMPHIERELRHRLFAMSVDDLEKLLNERDD